MGIVRPVPKGRWLMEVLACLNGETMPVEQARVPVWDRGFLFGDSVYEVCRIYRGRCWLEAEHFARLRRSLKELDFPPFDVDRLIERVHRTIAASGIQEGTVYHADHPGRGAPVPRLPRPAGAADRADRGPALRRRAHRPAPRDRGQGHQPSRPPLEALRHQVDQPPGQLPGDRGRPPRRLSRGDPGRLLRPRHRGDAYLVALGPAGTARGHPRRPRDPPRDDPPVGPAAGQDTGHPLRRGRASPSTS